MQDRVVPVMQLGRVGVFPPAIRSSCAVAPRHGVAHQAPTAAIDFVTFQSEYENVRAEYHQFVVFKHNDYYMYLKMCVKYTKNQENPFWCILVFQTIH